MRTSGGTDPVNVFVKLDGGLSAPAIFLHQETIVRGDATEPAISLASIIAKVTRDRYMVKQAKKTVFKPYNLAEHKGYGTKSHREAIATCGLSTLHRHTFCRNIVMKRGVTNKEIARSLLFCGYLL
jgi:ribonuclease HII